MTTHKCRDCDRQIPVRFHVCLICRNQRLHTGICWMCGNTPIVGGRGARTCPDCRNKREWTPPPDTNDTDPRRVEELGLPKGIQDLILLHTIFTVGELRRMAKSFRLKEIHGIGPEKAAIIGEALAKAWL